MLKKVISLSVIFVFLLTEITVDFHYLKGIHFSVPRAYADTATPYCLPTNDGTKTGTFSQEAGYCVLDPEDPTGKCLSPYVYSTEYKKCVSMPLCPGLYVWNSQTKQCESVSASPSGGTEPTFPENSCAVDANGNGEVEQNEIFQCQQTPQGYICPVGQTQCNPQYQQPTCPAQYTYNANKQKCETTIQGDFVSPSINVRQCVGSSCGAGCYNNGECGWVCNEFFWGVSNGYNEFFVNGVYRGTITSVWQYTCSCNYMCINGICGGRGTQFRVCRTVNSCVVKQGVTSEGIVYYYCDTSGSSGLSCPSGYVLTPVGSHYSCIPVNACPSGGTFNPSTGKCEATATCQTGTLQAEGCFTGYGCPLGQYQCHNINNTWMCSPYQCITSSQLQDEGDVIPSGYEDDGPRDEQGNCLGTIYIFNGKGMRCKKSGVQTGFHNCCNESQGKLYDSTGSTGGGIGAIGDVVKAMSGIYSAINVGQIASQLATNGASSIAITMQNGVVTRVVIPGYGTVTGQQAQSLVNGLMQNGNLQYLGQSGNETFVRVLSGGADTATAGTMSDFLKNSGIASSVVSLATSMLIQDPILSSAVNVAAQSVLWAFGYASPLGLATAVIGLAMNLFMKKCDKQDIMTSTFKESGYCHEVGEYCIKKWPLVGCVQKAKGFCCFNSKLARIIHEQGRPQLVGFGVNSWGDPKSPNCRGFLPEEFQALDFNKIDLSEYIEDIQRNIRQNLAPQLQQQIQQSWGQ